MNKTHQSDILANLQTKITCGDVALLHVYCYYLCPRVFYVTKTPANVLYIISYNENYCFFFLFICSYIISVVPDNTV